MAIRGNTKKARDRVQAYVLQNVTDYEYNDFSTFADAADFIDAEFVRQAYSSKYQQKQNRQQAFIEWSKGLPLDNLFTFWIYRTDPIELVGDILEESEQERARFTEEQAAEKMVYLIYAEVMRAKR